MSRLLFVLLILSDICVAQDVPYVIDNSRLEMKTYFPVGSTLIRTVKNSEFSGPVEEIKLRSGDRLDSWLTIHHDGKNHLV